MPCPHLPPAYHRPLGTVARSADGECPVVIRLPLVGSDPGRWAAGGGNRVFLMGKGTVAALPVF